ncbi:family 16 glycosylhydrolase [Roseicella aerolata]|uniref:Family 16 glycosylhydrolase n=1 Tax=Roseicella aerolata TaxID=2883479 RepID=A0A9X1II38_9PROT|nr:family 16 glycosylhydrolase [Roseicella aerolata]MCB4824882.1 family 16 glycosylhydrolase [Roseicella aerolata]
MTPITPGLNARGVWLASSGYPVVELRWDGAPAGSQLSGTRGHDAIWTPGTGAIVSGGAGDDSYYLFNASDEIVELPGRGIDTVRSYARTYRLTANVENLVVESDGAAGTGNDMPNILAGGAGNQTLDGGRGDDILRGGAGADVFVMQAGTGWDLITDFENGVDRLAIGAAYSQLTSFAAVRAAMSQVGTDVILRLSSTDAVIFQGKTLGVFTAQDFILTASVIAPGLNAGGAVLPASDSPVTWLTWNNQGIGTELAGTAWNDAIWMPGGGATVSGGAGDDLYHLYSLQDQVVELPDQGIDTIVSYVSAFLLPAHVENLMVQNASSSGTGNALANIIRGGAGSQTLDGGAGNDLLIGGAGADVFVMQPGTGRDLIADFENGVDALWIGDGFGQFTSFAAVVAAMTQSGSDVVLRLSGTDAVTFQGKTLDAFSLRDFILPTMTVTPGFNAIGTWLAASAPPTNWLGWASSAAGTSLSGSGSNDMIWTPGGGATVSGGRGDDTYHLYNMQDQVLELPDEGIDTVLSYLPAYRLPANIENLAVQSANSAGTGNERANILAGRAGSQTLDGGAGNDILTGGTGADVFVMQAGTGRDLITDFEHGVDRLVIGGGHAQFTSFAVVLAALTQNGSDVVLRLSATDSVTFAGKTLSAFSMDDFALPQASLMGSLRLIFSDDFTSFSGSSSGLDANGKANWRTTLMWGNRTLASNNEAQYYADPTMGANPFTLDAAGNGRLNITAKPTAGLPNGLTYSSGVITSDTIAVQTYGYFEMRAKIPEGAGFWPAFWLLRDDGAWPPEIDVMEILGDAPGRLLMTTRSTQTGTQSATYHSSEELSLDFHTYAVSWRPDRLTWYLDGTELYSMATPDDMHGPMYMVANLAVGGAGSWPGPADGVSSATLSIDYIRAYQFSDVAVPWRPPAVQGSLLVGTWSSDTIIGTTGSDRIEAGGGNDRLRGGNSADVFAFAPGEGQNVIVDFQPGIDKVLVYGVNSVGITESSAGLVLTLAAGTTVTLNGITALRAEDIVYADARLLGTAGADHFDRSAAMRAQYVSAGGGDDTVIGGPGDDFIIGGQGRDVLTGGAGRDTFAFGQWDGLDRITDFQPGIDRIMLRGIPSEAVWVNPARDADGIAGLQITYTEGQSIFLPGVTSLSSGDIVFSS